MKILFYLPAITPWWFETLIAPMLRALYEEAELHIIVGPLWCDTGLEMKHVEPLADLTALNWHIVSADNPADFVMDGADVDGLLDLVRAIDPDLTLARSADRRTPGFFPGIVRYITEPGCDPLYAPHRWFVLDEQPFHHGVMPDHLADLSDHAACLLEPTWQRLADVFAEPEAGAARALLGLPTDRPILALPLQYEHMENFFCAGSPLQYGPEYISELLDELDPRIMLAITDHPLNARYLIRVGLEQLAEKHPDRIRLYPWDKELGSPTNLLIRAADAVLLDRSKCVSTAAFLGTPIVHIGDSVLAGWMNATPLAGVTAGRMTNRGLGAPDPMMTRRWFGWHYGMRLINPQDITLAKLLDRVHHRTEEAAVTEFIAFLQRWFDGAISDAERTVAQHPVLTVNGQLAA